MTSRFGVIFLHILELLTSFLEKYLIEPFRKKTFIWLHFFLLRLPFAFSLHFRYFYTKSVKREDCKKSAFKKAIPLLRTISLPRILQ